MNTQALKEATGHIHTLFKPEAEMTPEELDLRFTVELATRAHVLEGIVKKLKGVTEPEAFAVIEESMDYLEETLAFVEEWEPKLIGVGVIMDGDHQEGMKALRALKGALPFLRTLAEVAVATKGGSHGE